MEESKKIRFRSIYLQFLGFAWSLDFHWLQRHRIENGTQKSQNEVKLTKIEPTYILMRFS